MAELLPQQPPAWGRKCRYTYLHGLDLRKLHSSASSRVFYYLSAQLLSHVQLFGIPWTIAHRLLCPQDSPGKDTGVGCHFLPQDIFLTQGLNLCLLRWQADSLPLSHLGSPHLEFHSIFKTLKPNNEHHNKRIFGSYKTDHS